MGDDVMHASYCNGDAQAPSCIAGTIQDCGAYACEATASQVVCHTDCDTSTDCAGAFYCELASNTCAAKLDNGQPGAAPDQCLSGFLADGVCCDAACDNGVCDGCSTATGATMDGVCTLVPQCDDNNPCTVDVCQAENGCVSNHVLDGTGCPDGVCVAGTCIPDSGGVTAGGGGGDAGSVGVGVGGADTTGTGAGLQTGTGPSTGGFSPGSQLQGGGICSVARPGSATKPEKPPGWLLLGAAACLLRRRLLHRRRPRGMRS
jgi:hypothetical protein